MNSVSSIKDDNNTLNIKMYILDPLSVIIKLAIISNKPVGTKLLITNNGKTDNHNFALSHIKTSLE